MKYYLEQIDTVIKTLGTSSDGLKEDEAARRLEKDGRNRLEEGKRVSLLQRFAKQLADPMIIVLIAAAIISGVTAVYEGESVVDSIIIIAVVLINSILGVVQESKAEQAIEALKEMTHPKCKVLRGGFLNVVDSEELVVGDVVLLEAGDAVPADCRLLESASLKAEESALTGESVPADKISEALSGEEVPLGDRRNMVYMGSAIVYGRGKAVVTGTGMNTEMGKIADALTQAKDEQTPLQKNLNKLSKILTYMVLGICVFMFLFTLLRTGDFSMSAVIDTFMLAVSLAVAAIPEGLAAVVTIVLSIGVTRMSKQNAVIRKMTAVETLGCTQVICSDKTGTLTQNKMTVVQSEAADKKALAMIMTLCTDADINQDGDVQGEPTECALVAFGRDMGVLKREYHKNMPRVNELPFDSERKLMSTVHQDGDGFIQFTKGAPDELLKRCTDYLDDDGQVRKLTEEKRAEILAVNKRYADQALRVLGGARRSYTQKPENMTSAENEQNLTFVGLVGMIDPVRPEVKAAMEKCRRAGIKVVMITGDHKDTAVAIGRELGIIESEQNAITGAELDGWSDEKLRENIDKIGVYARVQPEHKVRIVKAWQEKGYIAAMTGDGVNDAPALKNSHIGIGMGITGTDVTKNVADMVLADDNFATIVKAAEEGRRIYANIRKAIQYLLASNLSEVVSVFVSAVMGFTILSPIHILWINLITDTFPALALGMEEGEADIMDRPPRDSKDTVFSDGVGSGVVWQGLMISILTVGAYFIGHYIESGKWEIAQSADGMTMAFLTMSIAEVFHAYNLRAPQKSVLRLKTKNFFLIGSMLASWILTTIILYVPFLREIFKFRHISMKEYAVALLLGILVIPIAEAGKLIERKIRMRK